MRLISPALKHIVFPMLSRSGYLPRVTGSGPAVVTYHGVFPRGYNSQSPRLDGNLVSPQSLRSQLLLLRRRYHVISPEEFFHWMEGELELPPRSVLLTCDDGLSNVLTAMVPILQDAELLCLFFVTGASADPSPSMLWYEALYLMLSGAPGKIVLDLPDADIRASFDKGNGLHECWWKLVEQLSQFDRGCRTLLLNQIRLQLSLPENWQQRFADDVNLASRFFMLDMTGLQKLCAAGMSIGAHSVSHPILAKTPPDMASKEISESRAVLERALGKAIWAFAYPFGNASTVTRREVQLAEQAGFRCAFMNTGGGFGAAIERFAFPRVHVTADMTLSEFEAHVSGFYRSLRARLLGQREAVLSA